MIAYAKSELAQWKTMEAFLIMPHRRPFTQSTTFSDSGDGLQQLGGETAMSQDQEANRLQATIAALTATPGEEIMTDSNDLGVNQVPNSLFSFVRQVMMGTDVPHARLGARGPWTQQEDENLKVAIQQLGTRKWSDVARFVPSRTSKQCRERWFDRLAPELKRTPFEPWEDQIITERQREVGNRWSIIASLLPGRSPGSVKNRWYSGLKNGASVADPGLHAMMGMDGHVLLSHDHFLDKDSLMNPGDPPNDL
jgi:hypothetical protein